MTNTKNRLTSIILIIVLVFTVFSINTNSSFASSKNITLKVKALGQNSATLSWTKISSSYNGYAIFRNGKVIKYCGKKATKFTDTNLTAGSTYKYQIKSYKVAKKKQYYNTKTKKWQNLKPAKKNWKGKKIRKINTYSYKKSSKVVSIRINYAYYTITFKNWDGTIIKSQSYIQGSIPSCVEPSRPNEPRIAYTFIGWSPTITEVTENKTYIAQYEASNIYVLPDISNPDIYDLEYYDF